MLRVEMVLKRQLDIGILGDERHILGRGEKAVHHLLDRGERGAGIAGGFAGDGDLGRLALRLPVGERPALLVGRLDLAEIVLAGEVVRERLGERLVRLEERLDRTAGGLDQVERGGKLLGTDAAVAVGIEELESAGIKAQTGPGAGNRVPAFEIGGYLEFHAVYYTTVMAIWVAPSGRQRRASSSRRTSPASGSAHRRTSRAAGRCGPR